MYHPAGRESEKITKNTTKMELTVNGLEPDTEYEFVVSNVSMVATGQEMVRGKNSFKVTEKSGNIREKWNFKSIYLFFSLYLYNFLPFKILLYILLIWIVLFW